MLKESEVIARVAQVHTEGRDRQLPQSKQHDSHSHRSAIAAINRLFDMLQTSHHEVTKVV